MKSLQKVIILGLILAIPAGLFARVHEHRGFGYEQHRWKIYDRSYKKHYRDDFRYEDNRRHEPRVHRFKDGKRYEHRPHRYRHEEGRRHHRHIVNPLRIILNYAIGNAK